MGQLPIIMVTQLQQLKPSSVGPIMPFLGIWCSHALLMAEVRWPEYGEIRGLNERVLWTRSDSEHTRGCFS